MKEKDIKILIKLEKNDIKLQKKQENCQKKVKKVIKFIIIVYIINKL